MKLKRIANSSIAFSLLWCIWGCGASENFKHGYRTGSNIRSMIEIKDVAIALERYRSDHGAYPTAQSMEELKTVAANYLEHSTGIDKWGEAILVDCEPESYLLSSKGDDKIGTHEFGGPVDFSGHSITMQDGVFVQYYSLVEEAAQKYEAEIKASRANR